MAKLTAQAIFDRVAKHLLRQGRRSWSTEAGGCAYRGNDGDKCAVGCLILDREYDEAMENRPVCELLDKGALPMRLAPHVGLLTILQMAHDGCDDQHFVPAILARLRNIATDHGLKRAVLRGYRVR